MQLYVSSVETNFAPNHNPFENVKITVNTLRIICRIEPTWAPKYQAKKVLLKDSFKKNF